MRYYNYINEQILEEKLLDVFSLLDDINKKFEELKAFFSRQTEQTKKMFEIYKKYIKDKSSVTKEEIEYANIQTTNIFKMFGISTLIALPGGGLLLPILIKVCSKYGYEILPKNI